MGLDQKVLLQPVVKRDGLWAVSEVPDDKNIVWRDHGLYSGCILVMHGRSGLYLGDTARKRLACHCDDAKYCGGQQQNIYTDTSHSPHVKSKYEG